MEEDLLLPKEGINYQFEGGRQNIPAGDYVETQKFCFCMSLKCGIIFLAVFLIVNFLLEIVNLAVIASNEHFDSIYPTVYGIILIPIGVSVAFFIVWFCKDSKATRGLLPIGILLACIASLLLFIWIIVYISFMYNEK